MLHCGLRRLAALGGVWVTLVGAAAAQARTLTLNSPSAPGGACTLASNGVPVTTVPTGRATSATFRAALDAHAAPGRYRVVLSCPPSAPVTRLVTVRRGVASHTGTSLIRGVRYHLTWGPPAPSGPILPTNPTLPVIAHPQLTAAALAFAEAAWSASDGPALVASIERSGQCVALAVRMRPDVIPTVTKTLVAMSWMDPHASGRPWLNWDAKNWDVNAAAAGLAVGAAPRVGAIMVFHPSLATGPAGHIAYVTAVHADGTISVSEEHAPDLGRVTQRDVTPRLMSGQDIDFVY